METKATGATTEDMDRALGNFTVDDVYAWLACSNEAATRVWDAGGLLHLFILECERSVRKQVREWEMRCERAGQRVALKEVLGDEIRGLGTDLAMQVLREFKPDDNKPSHRVLTLDRPESFVHLLRKTMAHRARDRVETLVREPVIQARLRPVAVPREGDGERETEGATSLPGSGEVDGVAWAEGEMIDRYALKQLIEEIPPALGRFARWMGKTRAKGPRRLLEVLLEVYRDDPAVALLFLLGDESPPELPKAFREAVGAEVNPNTYYSHVRRLRVYFREFREETGLFEGGTES